MNIHILVTSEDLEDIARQLNVITDKLIARIITVPLEDQEEIKRLTVITNNLTTASQSVSLVRSLMKPTEEYL
jgi:hypothetical protein